MAGNRMIISLNGSNSFDRDANAELRVIFNEKDSTLSFQRKPYDPILLDVYATKTLLDWMRTLNG